ncbi:MAG: energy transducer TonB, partial [Hyphomicrobiales bacterium]
KQEQPISDAEPVKLVEAKPLELAKAVQPNMQKTMAVDTIVETTPPEPISEVIKAPAKKPETPIKKTNQFKKKKKKASRTAQKKGAETNTRKGGERITSQTARSNANGQANAKTNDGGTKARSNYKGKVVAKLRRAKRYPKQARREKLTGSVRVTFTISKNGSVSGVRVSRSSGHPILDKAALDMVRRASPMPKFPKDMKRTRMSLHVPVQFSR